MKDTTAVPVSAKAGNGPVVRRLRVVLLFSFGCLFLSVAAALVGAQAYSVIAGGDLQIGMWEFATLALFVVPPLLLIWPHRGAGIFTRLAQLIGAWKGHDVRADGDNIVVNINRGDS